MNPIRSILLCFIATTFLCKNPSFAQSLNQNEPFQKIDSVMKSGDYKEAVSLLKYLKSNLKKGIDIEILISAELKLSENYRLLNFLDSATAAANRVLTFSEKIDNIEKRELFEARAHTSIGIIKNYVDDFEQSIDILTDAANLKIKHLGSETADVAINYNYIAIGYFFMGVYDSAIYYHEKALSIRLKANVSDNLLANSYHNLAKVYRVIGKKYRANEYYIKALELRKNYFGPDHPDVAKSYISVASIYRKKGQLTKALEYHQKSYDIHLSAFGEYNYRTAVSLRNIAFLQKLLGNIPEALEAIDQSIKIQKTIYKKGHWSIINAKTLKAETLMMVYRFDEANVILDEVIGSSVDSHKENSLLVSQCYSLKAKTYQLSDDYETAWKYFKISFDILMNYHPEARRDISFAYLELAEFYRYFGKYDKALTHLSLAEEHSYLPDIKTKNIYANYLGLLQTEIPLIRAEVYEAQNNYKKALASIETADSLVTLYAEISTRYEDRLKINEISGRVNDLAVNCLVHLKGEIPDDNLVNRLLYFSSANKYRALSANLEENLAKSKSLIPDSLRTLEKYLKDQIAQYQYEKSSNTDQTSQQIDENLFQTRQSLDSLTQLFRDNYTGYYRANYVQRAVSLKAVKNKLADRSALIEYIMTKRNQLLIYVDRDTSFFATVNGPEVLKNVRKFREIISNRKVEYKERFNLLTNTAHQLYIELFSPIVTVAEGKIEHITIVTDHQLNVLPFELLVETKTQPDNYNYGQVDFLIKKHKINYQLSTDLLLRTKSPDRESELYPFVGFSPSFDQSVTVNGSRSKYAALAWNLEEVKSIQRMMGGKAFYRSEANKENFKNYLTKSEVVHIASHAIMKYEDPMSSKVAFTPQNDSAYELHAFEIYQMPVRAELVTLSGCETGLGPLKEGEGTMSLAHSFLYAGASSVVLSQWEVNDKYTYQLMTMFYKYLTMGQSKDEALRNAKLEFLETNDQSLADPYFWAAFIHIGEPVFNKKPVVYSDKLLLTVISITLIVSILLLFIYRINASDKQKAVLVNS